MSLEMMTRWSWKDGSFLDISVRWIHIILSLWYFIVCVCVCVCVFSRVARVLRDPLDRRGDKIVTNWTVDTLHGSYIPNKYTQTLLVTFINFKRISSIFKGFHIAISQNRIAEYILNIFQINSNLSICFQQFL